MRVGKKGKKGRGGQRLSRLIDQPSLPGSLARLPPVSRHWMGCAEDHSFPVGVVERTRLEQPSDSSRDIAISRQRLSCSGQADKNQSCVHKARNRAEQMTKPTSASKRARVESPGT